MAVIETWLRQDLKGLVTVRSLQGQVFSLDNGGNLIGVKVTKDGKPVTLTGTVTGYCILSDGQTVTVTGSGSSGIQNGNEAYIVLPQLVYSVPGQISIVIKLTSGSVTTTLAACTGYVYRSRTSNEVVPPGTPIPDLATMEEVIRRATEATDAANAATVGAEKVDASMTKEGDVITIAVTDRDGNVTEKTVTDQTEAMKKKADVDGNHPDLTAGNAEQLVSTQYVENTELYKFRPTGGSADVGNREYLEKIVGGTVCWNQLVHGEVMSNAGEWISGSITVTASDGVLTLTAVGDSLERSAILKASAFGDAFDGHVYMYSVDAIANRDGIVWLAGMDRGSVNYNKIFDKISISSSWGNFSNVIKFTSIEGRVPGIRFGATADAMADSDYISLKNLMRIDLTAMFGPTIADYVYNLEQTTAGAGVAWFRRYFSNDYYQYNPGELISVSGLQSHDTVGFNVWDEVTEIGSINTSGAETSTAGYYRTKNYIRVIGGTNYYFKLPVQMSIFWYDCDKTFVSYSSALNQVKTAPDNACYLRFRNSIANSWVPSDTDDICINLSHSGTRNGEYEPYEKHSYPLDSGVVLRGIPKLNENSNLYFDGDEYPPDGQVSRKYGIVDLGTLKWSYDTQGTNPIFFTNDIGSFAKTENFTIRIICNKYTALPSNSRTSFREGSQNKDMILTSTGIVGTICVRDDAYTDATSFKTAMSGVMLVYELATPTTEQAEPYTEVQICSDWGTEEFVSDSILPVGHLTRYPANLRDKLQHLPSPAETDGEYIIQQTGNQMTLKSTAEIRNNISDIESAISAQGIYVDTDSSPIVSISDGADDQPMKSVKVAIEPVQDLHGYDAPWPAGGGKNKAHITYTSNTVGGITITVNSDGTFTTNGTASKDKTILIGAYDGVSGTRYTITGCPSGGGSSTYRLYASSLGNDTGNGATGSYNSGATNISLQFYAGANMNGLTFKPMVHISSETDATFAPYSNVCPISGWTGAKVTRCGKNLLDKSLGKLYAPFFVIGGNTTEADNTLYLKAGTYTISTSEPTTMYLEDAYQNRFLPPQRNVTSATFTNPKDQYCKFSFTRGSSDQATPDTYDYQLEIGSTVSDYEPYLGNTYEVTFPADSGTVYGGTLDVVSGKLVVDRVLLSTTWGDGGSETTYEDRKRRRWSLPVGKKSNPALSAMCNLAVQSSSVSAPINCFTLHSNGDYIYLSLAPDTADSTEIQFCYYLKSPSDPITLTPTEITTLLGLNNIWSDAGAIEVEYPADTKTYIDNRINATRRLIAGIETGFVASKPYAVGDMLIIGDDLYKVASSIASGATITVGTNVTKTTVAEQLIALANA